VISRVCSVGQGHVRCPQERLRGFLSDHDLRTEGRARPLWLRTGFSQSHERGCSRLRVDLHRAQRPAVPTDNRNRSRRDQSGAGAERYTQLLAPRANGTKAYIPLSLVGYARSALEQSFQECDQTGRPSGSSLVDGIEQEFPSLEKGGSRRSERSEGRGGERSELDLNRPGLVIPAHDQFLPALRHDDPSPNCPSVSSGQFDPPFSREGNAKAMTRDTAL
jgi:hypothetical protein